MFAIGASKKGSCNSGWGGGGVKKRATAGPPARAAVKVALGEGRKKHHS